MPSTVLRSVLRQSQFALRRAGVRNASTTTTTAGTTTASPSTVTKAKDAVSSVTSKASEGLSKVTSSAGETVSSAASAVTNATGQATGRVGRMVSTVQSMIPPTIYYSRVGLEVGKLIFKGQGMAPPSMSHLQAYYQPILSGLRNPNTAFANTHGIFHPVEWLERMRNMNSKDFVAVGVVAAEVLGFWTVGEMIGKMKVVGYTSETAAHH